MNDLPPKFVLSVKPKEYLQQGFSYCGMYVIKGILSAYGRDNKSDIRDYSLSWLGKYTGWTFPWVFPKLLQKYGFTAEIRFAKEKLQKNKIDTLKRLLVRNKAPVILLIGNGYLPNGSHSSRKAKTTIHWITLWGYDDEEKVFYIYDSAVPKDLYDKNISVGNKKRTYIAAIRDWGSIIVPPWPWNYLYIAINENHDRN